MFDQKKEELKMDQSSIFASEIKPNINPFDFGFDNFDKQVNQTVVIEPKAVDANAISFDNWGFNNEIVNQTEIFESRQLEDIEGRKNSQESLN